MYYRIRAIRSTIGLPKAVLQRFHALGLRKRGSVVYQDVNPATAGQIMAIKELVNVQLVNKRLTLAEERKLRSPPKGYTIERSA